jgi:transcriptional regulator with XRE-family HTH domain
MAWNVSCSENLSQEKTFINGKALPELELCRYAVDVATVGENFRRIRTDKKITQEQIYKRLGFRRPSNVSLLETSKRLPTPATIRKMAKAVHCETWELLENVQTPHDELRRSTVPQPHRVDTAIDELADKPGGQHLANLDGQTDPLSSEDVVEERRLRVALERRVRTARAAAARTARSPRKPVTAVSLRAAGARARDRKTRR